MKVTHLWKFIRKQLESSRSVVLLCVVESDGSSPGRQGFKMAVAENQFFGSIGGGIMEHKFVEFAKSMLRSKQADVKLVNQVHDKIPGQNQSGMICSGEQTNVLLPLNQSNLITVENILKSQENNTEGRIELSPAGISFFSGKSEAGDFYFEWKAEADWIYREKTGIKNHLYVIGGGRSCIVAVDEWIEFSDSCY
jgi:xanthine dehydrogenase accessory factor